MQSSEFKECLEKTGEIGRIIYASDPIVFVSGLPSLRPWETVITEDGKKGMIYGVSKEKAEVLMFDTEGIEAGKKIARTGQFFSVPVSDQVLGRVFDPLGVSLDGKGEIKGKKEYQKIKREAPGITERVEINEPLETGVPVVDLLVPIGYGQREMVVGDAKTGKTTLLLQTISNQARKGIICIYVGIAKESSSFKEVESYLQEMGVFDKVAMMITTSNQPPTLHYIAPLAGMTIAEYFRDQGKKVLIVFDDLSKHAKAYREIALLLKNPPAREAYPGDIFFLHSSLVERAGNIKLPNGTVTSITALPVAETLENDISGFIQTNLLSMTDGHIFFDVNELRKGRNPAINTFLSVSRAGNQTRGKLDKDLAGKIRERMVEYRKVLAVTQFGAELSKENQAKLDFGKKLEVLFNQGLKDLISRPMQLLLFGLLFTGFWRQVPLKTMEKEVEVLIEKLASGKIKDFEESLISAPNAEKLKDYCEEIALLIEKMV